MSIHRTRLDAAYQRILRIVGNNEWKGSERLSGGKQLVTKYCRQQKVTSRQKREEEWLRRTVEGKRKGEFVAVQLATF